MACRGAEAAVTGADPSCARRGAQGGTLEAVCAAGWAEALAGGLLVNVGRSLMYASSGKTSRRRPAPRPQRLQQAMAMELAASR